jgi:hypothetical protein
VRAYLQLKLSKENLDRPGEPILAGGDRKLGRNRFRAVKTQVRVVEEQALLPREAKQLLELRSGATVSLIPLG